MPWDVRKRGDRYCVIKQGESSPIPGGCHATRAEAVRHQRALYAGEAAQNEEVVTVSDPNPLWKLVGPSSGVSTTPLVITAENFSTDNNITWVINPDVAIETNGKPAEFATEEIEWEGVLAVEGIVTSDGRYLMPGKIDHRVLPLTLMAQTVTDEGHKGAFAAGKIVEITRQDRPDLGDGAVAIIGRGVFADTEEGQLARQLLEDEVLRHVSIDFAPTETHMLDADSLEPIEDEDLGLEALLNGDFVRGFEGKIMGATLCAFSAFEEATMQIVEIDADRAVVASAFPMRKALTASAAGLAPLAPPYDWFFQEETVGPCPLTVTPEGKVYGHLALWNQCHRSMSDMCEMAPRSRSGYAFFHTGALTTDDGRKVNVGRITVGEGGHAPTDPRIGMKGAIDHYDKTGTVGAFVRATDGRYGIWLSGCIRSDAPAEKIRDLEANPPSGDWRDENGRLELCAALSVPVAGFPVPRYEAALVASGVEERVVALIAAGYSEPTGFTRAQTRKFERLKHGIRELLADKP